jgi:hypothetical protein
MFPGLSEFILVHDLNFQQASMILLLFVFD